jgi:hypothetical protein
MLGDAGADAFGGSGDDCDFTFEFIHNCWTCWVGFFGR